MSTSRGIAITVGGNIAGPISMIIVTPLLARTLGPVGRGEVAAATVPLTLLAAALTFGLPEALTKLGASDQARRSRLGRSAIPILALAGVVGASLLWWIAPAVSTGSAMVQNLIRVTALALIPLLVIWAFRGLAQAAQDWRSLALDRTLTGSVRVVGVVMLTALGAVSVTTVVWVLVSALIAGGIAYLAQIRRLFVYPRELSRTTERSAFFRFGMAVWAGSLAGILLTRVDQLLLAGISDTRELGYYAVAANVGEIFIFVLVSVSTVMMSEQSRKFDLDRALKASRITLFALLSGALSLSITAKFWMPVIFGDEFNAAIPAAILLLWSAVVLAPGSIAGAVLTSRGHPGVRSGALAVALVVDVVLVMILVPPYGALGAAAGTLIATLVSTSILLASMRSHLGARILDSIAVTFRDLRDIKDIVSVGFSNRK